MVVGFVVNSTALLGTATRRASEGKESGLKAKGLHGCQRPSVPTAWETFDNALEIFYCKREWLTF